MPGMVLSVWARVVRRAADIAEDAVLALETPLALGAKDEGPKRKSRESKRWREDRDGSSSIEPQ